MVGRKTRQCHLSMHQQPLDALACVGEVDLRIVDSESFDDGAEGKLDC